VLVEAVRGDKKKEAYEYFVLVRRKDKTDESRRCFVRGIGGGKRRKEKGRKKEKREALIYLEAHSTRNNI
jgi:hypothetical protein